MRRQGVVLLSPHPTFASFLQHLVEEHAREERRLLEVSTGRDCVAVVNGSRRRRLLVVDGEPPDVSASHLIKAIRTVDPRLPIVLVRLPRGDKPVVRQGNNVHVVARGPGVPVESLIADLLRHSVES